jgi:hypothetical protein
VNLLVINALLAKMNFMPFFFSNKKQAAGLAMILIVVAFIYFKGDKSNHIIEKYSGESKSDRIKGNVIVGIYVGLSFLLIFAVAFFRPGKL